VYDEYVDGNFIRSQEWGGQLGAMVVPGRNITLDITGPPFRFLVANMTLTRRWEQAVWNGMPLKVWLDSPQAIRIYMEWNYYEATGRALTPDRLRFQAAITGSVHGELFSESLLSIGSGQSLSAERAAMYYLTLNATSWPAFLDLSTTIEPIPKSDSSLLFWVVLVAAPAAVLLLLILATSLRRGRRSTRDVPNRLSSNKDPSDRRDALK